MSIFRDFFVKEKPVFTGITRGIGGFGFGKAVAVLLLVVLLQLLEEQYQNTLIKMERSTNFTCGLLLLQKQIKNTAGSTLTGDVIVIGGGGAGGDYAGGGGGAGGVLYW